MIDFGTLYRPSANLYHRTCISCRYVPTCHPCPEDARSF